MKNKFIKFTIVVAIFTIVSGFVLLGEVDQVQAQENYVWFLPIMHKNYMPNHPGCNTPDLGDCQYVPPYGQP